jgi:hypothetical protein
VAGAVSCLGLLAVGATGGCSSPVDVGAPAQAPAECRRLVDALPASVDGQERREVAPPDAPAAAWGDPPIVLRCGVPMPPGYRPTALCAEVDHVGWFTQERDDHYRFTTVGRSVNVQVQVPYEYEPAADALVDVAAAVRSAVPEERPCL